jgi:hypothetical protein
MMTFIKEYSFPVTMVIIGLIALLAFYHFSKAGFKEDSKFHRFVFRLSLSSLIIAFIADILR